MLDAMRLLGPGGRARVWLGKRRITVMTWIARRLGDHIVKGYLANRTELADYLESFQSGIPQAQVVDRRVVACETRDWRALCSGKLQGRGLELGALHRPMETHSGMTMTYMDRADRETLRQQFPTVAEGIVQVDVIDDAETLATVADGSFDFVVAAHVIEHMRNPIGAIVNWLRVVREGGHVYLVVPDKRRTFDKLRVRTPLAHLVLDYQQPSRERDFEHFLDYSVHVHHAQIDQAIEEATRLRNIDYSIHFHVFLPTDVAQMVEWIDGHVTPVSIAEGPVLSPGSDEFHLLVRKEPAR
jgi:SAM-dependent methyltransferase